MPPGIARNSLGWLLLGFAVAAAYWPGLPAEALAPRWAIIAVGAPLVSRLAPRTLSGGGWVLLLWLAGLAAVSLIASPDRLAGTGELFFILILCGAFVAAAGLDDLDAAMTGLGWGLAVSAAFCIPQVMGYRPVAQGSGPPAGLFYNSEVLAEFAAIIFVWAILRPRWWIAAIAAVPLALCQSRVSYLVVALGLLYAWTPRSRLLKWGVVVPSCIIAAIAVLVFMGVAKQASAGHRIVLWLGMVEAITPLGRGLGWGTAALPLEQFMHSDALQAVVELGFGAVALIAIPILAFQGERGNRAERAAFLAVCAEVLVSFPLRVPATGFVAALLAGLLVGRGSSVRLGVPLGGDEDGGRFRGAEIPHCRIPAGGDACHSRARGRGGRAVSLRSRFAKAKTLFAARDGGRDPAKRLG